MGQKRSVFRFLLDEADLAEEALPGQSVVEVLGDERVLIEHHRGVVEYCPQYICARVGFGMVRVLGCGLHLRYMSGQKLVIMGRIDALELVRGRDK